MDGIKTLRLTGQVSLWIGIESFNWTIKDFQSLLTFCKDRGIDSLFVKVYDGTNAYYQGNFQPIYNLITSTGLLVIPYTFMYGDTFGALDQEIDQIEQLMNTYGIACGNLEGAWDNHPDWGTRVNKRLSSNPNQFLVSILANPSEHGQIQLLKNMKPSINAFAPQVYDSYLNGKWRQDMKSIGAEVVFPSVHLTEEVGPNPVETIVKDMGDCLNIGLWYEGFARKDPEKLKRVISNYKGVRMAQLDFPVVAQQTTTTTDNQPSENALFDCVPASLGAMVLYYQKKDAWTKDTNPDVFKDKVYGQGYTDTMVPDEFVQFLNGMGYNLKEIKGTNTFLVSEVHRLLKLGIPVGFTMPDPYDSTPGATHFSVFCGEGSGTLTHMDVFVAEKFTNPDSYWKMNLQFGSIWTLEPIKEVKVLQLKDVSKYFRNGSNDNWWVNGLQDYRNGKNIQLRGEIRKFYRSIDGGDLFSLNGFSIFGLPISNEQVIEEDVIEQQFERTGLRYDPKRKKDAPPGVKGPVYAVHLDKMIEGWGELNDQLAGVLKQVTNLQDTITQTNNKLSEATQTITSLTNERVSLLQQLDDWKKRADDLLNQLTNIPPTPEEITNLINKGMKVINSDQAKEFVTAFNTFMQKENSNS